MIFIDPTESREGSRLPPDVIRISQELPGLEKHTGADLLISPIDKPRMTEITDTLPSQTALDKHCEVGALVQRKSGTDFTNSIRRLKSIQARMQEKGSNVWLLITGNIQCPSGGKVVVDHVKTGYTYNNIIGVLNWWQLRGGRVMWLCSDSQIAMWLTAMERSLKECMIQKDKLVRPVIPVQRLVGDNFDLSDKTEAARITLEVFPYMGPHRAKLLADRFETLGGVVTFLSNRKLWGYRPKGVGEVTLEKARAWLGVSEGVILEARSDWNDSKREAGGTDNE